jgi:hypothetical protein
MMCHAKGPGEFLFIYTFLLSNVLFLDHMNLSTSCSHHNRGDVPYLHDNNDRGSRRIAPRVPDMLILLYNTLLLLMFIYRDDVQNEIGGNSYERSPSLVIHCHLRHSTYLALDGWLEWQVSQHWLCAVAMSTTEYQFTTIMHLSWPFGKYFLLFLSL